jgi:hypothetical protein
MERITVAELRELQASEKTNKYRNKPVRRNGIWFRSTGEADRNDELLVLELAGEISDLRRQVPYRIEFDGYLVKTYHADFVYFDRRTGKEVVEDWKGCRTREFILTKKLMLAVWGIEILETGRGRKSKRGHNWKGKQLWQLKKKHSKRKRRF